MTAAINTLMCIEPLGIALKEMIWISGFIRNLKIVE
jgi:hypothetical protein